MSHPLSTAIARLACLAALMAAAGSSVFPLRAAAQTPTLLNVVRAGGTGEDEGYGVAIDGNGNAVVTGGFKGTATFG